jgi:hypothetical protein
MDGLSAQGAHADDGVAGLGFRFVEDEQWVKPNLVGLNRFYETLCPPNYPDMEAAVQAFVNRKFGRGPRTIPTSRTPGRTATRSRGSVEPYTRGFVDCLTEVAQYIYAKYGKSPGTRSIIMLPGSSKPITSTRTSTTRITGRGTTWTPMPDTSSSGTGVAERTLGRHRSECLWVVILVPGGQWQAPLIAPDGSRFARQDIGDVPVEFGPLKVRDTTTGDVVTELATWIVYCTEQVDARMIRIDAGTGDEVSSVVVERLGTDRLGFVGYAPGGEFLLAVRGHLGKGGGSLVWFDAETFEVAHVLERIHEGPPKSFAQSPSGRLVATGSSDVYTLDVDELQEIVAGSLTRGFTTTECERYGFGAECPTLEELRGSRLLASDR